MWFVIYEGDLEVDPINRGVNDFENFEDASDFAFRMMNKGYVTFVYKGELRASGVTQWSQK